MKLLVERFTSDDDTTLGLMFRDSVFECFTLGDEHRTVKVFGETRIPAGTYPIELRADERSDMHKKYAARYPDIHRGMLWLRDVPNFTFIYIHVGNDDDDTAGCILVGLGANAGTMTIQSSVKAYRRLYEAVVDAAQAGDLFIEVVDRDAQ